MAYFPNFQQVDVAGANRSAQGYSQNAVLNHMNAFKLGQDVQGAQRADAARSEIKNAFVAYLNGDTAGFNNSLGKIANADPNTAMNMLQGREQFELSKMQRQAAADEVKAKRFKMGYEHLGRLATMPETHYALYRQQMIKDLPEIAGYLPETYNKDYFNSFKDKKVNVTDGGLITDQDGNVLADHRAPKPEGPRSEVAKINADFNAGLITEWQRDQAIAKALKSDSGGYAPDRTPSGYRWRPDGTRLEVIPGGPADQPPKAPKLSFNDERAVNKARDVGDAAGEIQGLLNEASGILTKFPTSGSAPIVGGVDKFKNAVGLANDEIKGRLEAYERLNSISRMIGAKTLQLFGGSDTEKELQVAIETTISPDKSVATNNAIIVRQMKAAEILQQKPQFMEQWINNNGNLMARDAETGATFTQAWREFQRQNFNLGAHKQTSSHDNDPLGLR